MNKLQEAVNEIRAVCQKHGVVLIGVGDSVYGEILVAEANDVRWSGHEKRLTNTVEARDGCSVVAGIGDHAQA